MSFFKTSLFMAISFLWMLGCGEMKRTTTGCIDNEGATGIVGGQVVAENDPLSQKVVFLYGQQEESGKTGICTGTVVGRDLILTAAHCVESFGHDQITAVFAVKAASQCGIEAGNQLIRSATYVVHDDYDGESLEKSILKVKNDLALIKLQEPVPAHYPAQPLYAGQESYDKNAVMAGYGLTGEKRSGSAGVLRQISKNAPLKITLSPTRDQLIVDQTDRQGACLGDSGGPLFLKVNGQLEVAGVTSVVGGPEGLHCQGFAVYMYLPYYMDWIQSQIRLLQ